MAVRLRAARLRRDEVASNWWRVVAAVYDCRGRNGGGLTSDSRLRNDCPMKTKLTAVLRREEGDYVALNPELDIASQGSTREEALSNL